ncbi:MAG: hypothetical protein WA875_07395 [Candidatus Acidiferrales bacterium]
MAQDNILDPAVNLAAVEAKITALQALAASWRAAIAVGALGPVSDVPLGTLSERDSQQPIELPQGAFRGMSIPAAIKLFLSAAKRKQTIKQIADALKDGGMETTSASLVGVVTGALNRLKDKEVLRFKDGWDLAEHYNEHLRARLTKDKGAKVQKRKRGRSRKAKQNVESKSKGTPHQDKQEKSVPQRMFDALSGKELSAAEIASAVGIKSNVAALLMGKLVANKWAEKTAGGKYRAIKAA